MLSPEVTEEARFSKDGEANRMNENNYKYSQGQRFPAEDEDSKESSGSIDTFLRDFLLLFSINT